MIGMILSGYTSHSLSVLSSQKSFSVTRTVCFGLQSDGHALLQVCFLVLSLHSFILLKPKNKCALQQQQPASVLRALQLLPELTKE